MVDKTPSETGPSLETKVEAREGEASKPIERSAPILGLRRDAGKSSLEIGDDDFLRTIWLQAQQITGIESDIDLDLMKEVVRQTIRDIREAGGDDGLFSDALVPENAEAAAQQLNMEMSAFTGEPMLRTFLIQRLRPAIVELLRRGETPENVTDMVISLSRQLPARSPQTTAFITGAVPSLLGLMKAQARRDSGWSATVNALAILLSTRTNNPDDTLPERIVLYHESIRNIVELGNSVTESGRRALDQAVTNMLASLSSLPVRFRIDKPEAWKRIYKSLQPLMIALELVEGGKDPGSDALEAMRMAMKVWGWPVSDLEPQQLLTALRVVDAMSAASDALGLERGSLERTNIYLMAGAVRAMLGKANRVASSLFNAGVEVARLANSPNQNSLALARVRSGFNALGLWWALELNADLATALGDGDGADCAVNLLGSLVAMTDHGAKPDLGTFPAEILATLMHMDADQRQRITGAFDRLGLKPAATAPDRRRLQSAVLAVVTSLDPQLHKALGKQPTPVTTLHTCLSSLRHAVPAEVWNTGLAAATTWFEMAYQPFLTSPDVLEMLQKNYRSYMQDGPLVAEGAMSLEVWQEWVARTHRPFDGARKPADNVDQIFVGLAQ
ncbi:MAG: hypothetical protein AB1918_10790 [Pseudomonadota bacterium]